ncbi:MAG: serine hydrolase domain-containing protein, partial [Alphaproteobacteria bacterium]
MSECIELLFGDMTQRRYQGSETHSLPFTVSDGPHPPPQTRPNHMPNRLQQAIETDIESNFYDGAATIVAIGGEILFKETTGYADRPNKTPLRHDSVFPIFSISKALTAVALLQRIERGEAGLDTPVSEVIPEFGTKGKARATLGQLLCHTAGVAPGFPAVASEMQGNLQACVTAACDTPAVSVPGEEASYSQIMAHAVAAECVRKLDGKGLRFRDIVKRDILDPLEMTDTHLGMRKDLSDRGIVPRCADRSPGLFDPDTLVAAALDIMNPALDQEIPAAGFVSTLNDIYAFANALRNGGRRGDACILSPAMIAFATKVHTGTKLNSQWHFAREMRGWPAFPANLGLGFFIRGEGM